MAYLAQKPIIQKIQKYEKANNVKADRSVDLQNFDEAES